MNARSLLAVVFTLTPLGCGALHQLAPVDEVRAPARDLSAVESDGWIDARVGVALEEADRQLAAGRVDQARATLEGVRGANAAVSIALARLAVRGGRPSDAESDLLEAGGLAPHDASIDMMLGELYESTGRWDEAREVYRAASLKDPALLDAVLGEARALQARGDAALAIARLEREVGSRPASGPLERALGYALLADGRADEAARAFARAQSLLSDTVVHVGALLVSLVEAGRLDDVLALGESLEVEALPPEAQLAFGHAALRRARVADAVRAFSAYLTEHPGAGAVWLDLARAYVLAGDDDRAFEAVAHSLRERPDAPDALVLLGHVRARAGQLEHALAAYHEALRVGADDAMLAPVVAQIEQVLAEVGDADGADEGRASAPGSVATADANGETASSEPPPSSTRPGAPSDAGGGSAAWPGAGTVAAPAGASGLLASAAPTSHAPIAFALHPDESPFVVDRGTTIAPQQTRLLQWDADLMRAIAGATAAPSDEHETALATADGEKAPAASTDGADEALEILRLAPRPRYLGATFADERSEDAR